tara:strand:+ start:1620 stop:3761 length:2142 start_codon:yes stop_codon:yes gene_type:complete
MATTVSKNRLNVTELDYDQIRANLKTFMQNQTELVDYDFEGSALSTLIDVLAYNTFYNAFNANVQANELYLDTAQVRNNIVSHAKSLGYLPRSRTSPFADLDVTVNSPSGTPSSLTVSRGTKFSSTINNKKFNFVNLESKTISPVGGVYKFSALRINQGTLKTFTYTVDDSDTRQKYEIPDTNVDTNSMVVKVFPNAASSNSDIYSLVSNIVNVTGTSEVYFLQEGLDGKYEIYFGDNSFGKKLAAGNVVSIEYLVTDGVEANNATSFALEGNIQGNTNVTLALVNKAAGGAAREDIESIRFNAPLSFLSQNRVVTADDYSTIIKNQYANAETVSVWGGEENDPPEYGKVFVSVKPKNAATLTASEKAFIKDSILKPKNIVSITPELIDPTFLYIKLGVFVKYDPNLTSLTAGELTQKVRQVISDYNDTNLKKFDGVFRHSQLLGEIDNADTSILNSTCNVSIQKRLTPTLNQALKYVVNFDNGFFSNVGAADSIISSTTFTFNGLTQQLQDAPITTFAVDQGASTGPYAVYGTETGNYAGSKGYFYPLYTTAEAANNRDIVAGGSGQSHTHTFLEFNGITFYMPMAFNNHGLTSYDNSLYTLFSTRTSTTTRDVQIFRLTTTNQKIVSEQKAGTVDIVNGTVTLDSFSPSAVNGSYITITARPNSNDIAPQRNQLLEIDLNEVTVTPQVDTVSTGGTVAGIGYVTTPTSSGY